MMFSPFRTSRTRSKKNPPTHQGGGFTLAGENFVSAISRCTSNPEHSFLIQGTLRLQSQVARLLSRKSFLMSTCERIRPQTECKSICDYVIALSHREDLPLPILEDQLKN